MQYVGSKRLLAKEILPIILKDREPYQYYVEPFVGGFNMIEHVNGNRIANDINFYLIELYRHLQQGWLPPEHLSEEEYKLAKNNKKIVPPHLLGFIGFGCSFGAKWFGGFARSGKGSIPNWSYNSIKKQIGSVLNIILYNREYWDFYIPPKSLIYCDPPYHNTLGYGGNKEEFNHYIFWEWVRYINKMGHKVFVSEYTAPNDFECIFEKEVKRGIEHSDNNKRTEKLWVLK